MKSLLSRCEPRLIDSIPDGPWCPESSAEAVSSPAKADMARRQREDLHFWQKFGIIGQSNCRIEAKRMPNRKFQMTHCRTSLLPLAFLVVSVVSVVASIVSPCSVPTSR